MTGATSSDRRKNNRAVTISRFSQSKMRVTPLFLVSLWSLWQGVVLASLNQTIRIEIDPDVSTITEVCTAEFMANMTAMISLWFTNGVSSYRNGSYPLLPFKKFVTRGSVGNNGHHGAGNNGNGYGNGNITGRRAMHEEMPSSNVAAQEGRQEERKLCSYNTCRNCCRQSCTTFCTNGSCSLCGSSRKLRGNTGASDAYHRAVQTTNDWWYGDQKLQSDVQTDMETAARQWLASNDVYQCMGDPTRVQLMLNYF